MLRIGHSHLAPGMAATEAVRAGRCPIALADLLVMAEDRQTPRSERRDLRNTHKAALRDPEVVDDKTDRPAAILYGPSHHRKVKGDGKTSRRKEGGRR